MIRVKRRAKVRMKPGDCARTRDRKGPKTTLFKYKLKNYFYQNDLKDKFDSHNNKHSMVHGVLHRWS